MPVLRYTDEMMPEVTVPPRLNGLPIATTQSPTRAWLELPKCTNGNGSRRLILSTARSDCASRPTTSASYSVPSTKVTVTSSSSVRWSGWITWLLVTTKPSAEMMNPEPSDCASRVVGWPPCWLPNRSAKGVPASGLASTVIRCRVEMLTTAGWSCSVRSAKLAGAPARGTTRSSFWATWAPAGWPVMSERAAPPVSSAVVMP